MNGDKCTAKDCTGQIDDGYCNICGLEAANAAPVGKATAADSGVLSASMRTGNTGTTSAAGSSRRSTSASRASSRKQLGLGLVQVASLPKADPEKAIMADPTVPLKKRFCSNPNCVHNEKPLFDEALVAAGKQKPRETGACTKCGTKYNFKPGLKKGDMVADQYEVSGPIAFGGMGWIYLGLDKTLNRWVVLKGLLNSDDPALAAAAVAERQYLAEVKHSNIVGIYTFVTHGNAGYIVMEFVGGKTLKSIRKDGPMPVATAIAYIHRTLGAFAYMHHQGLVYCDMKPDNVMLEEDDIKVVDLGGVRRLTDTEGDIYGTIGYNAPEVAKEGVSVVSDLYTIGRTLWVLTCEAKGNTKAFQYSLPLPSEEPLFAKYPSFYRFLLRACHENPHMRFQSADEMADQLLGVLREVVAQDTGKVKAGDSTSFNSDALALMVDVDGRTVDTVDAQSLPSLKRDSEDPATAFINANLSADPKRQKILFEQALTQFGRTSEALLGMARALIVLGDFQQADKLLAEAQGKDAFDWRVTWLRGALCLNAKQYTEAQKAFDACYSELPGDLAPKLALAIAYELGGNVVRAIELYETVSRTDPSFATATFGLARCLAKQGKRAAAVAALGCIPQTSSLFGEARQATALTLMQVSPATPAATDLSQAAQVIEALALGGVKGCLLAVDLFKTALDLVKGRKLAADGAVIILGQSLQERSLRLGLEHYYREMAKLERDPAAKIKLVDQANQVRPRTVI